MGWTIVEYVEKASGKAGSRRPQLDQLLNDARLRKFDVVLVWKMDRFGRSLQHLVENVRTLDSLGIRFIAPSQMIDTDTKSPMGKFLMHIFAAFAEFERDLIVERVAAGVKQYQADYKTGKARSRSGRNLPIGRPRRIFHRERVAELRRAGWSWRQIAKELGIAVSTLRQVCGKPT